MRMGHLQDFPKALEYIKQAGEKDPTSVDVKLLQAEIMMELGQKAEAKAMLDSIDMTKVKDPYPFINSAINLINDGKAVEAVDALTKLAAQFPTTFTIYYYRGRANLAASKFDEAKADLEKFVSMVSAQAASGRANAASTRLASNDEARIMRTCGPGGATESATSRTVGAGVRESQAARRARRSSACSN